MLHTYVREYVYLCAHMHRIFLIGWIEFIVVEAARIGSFRWTNVHPCNTRIESMQWRICRWRAVYRPMNYCSSDDDDDDADRSMACKTSWPEQGIHRRHDGWSVHELHCNRHILIECRPSPRLGGMDRLGHIPHTHTHRLWPLCKGITEYGD